MKFTMEEMPADLLELSNHMAVGYVKLTEKFQDIYKQEIEGASPEVYRSLVARSLAAVYWSLYEKDYEPYLFATKKALDFTMAMYEKENK